MEDIESHEPTESDRPAIKPVAIEGIGYIKNEEKIELVYVDDSIRTKVKTKPKVLKTLTKIDFTSRGVFKLPVFTDFGNLSELRFANNYIKQLQSESFKSLFNLTYINLSQNLLTNIDEDIFDECRNLSYVDFSKNSLTALDRNLFRHTLLLRAIDFSHNRIKELDENIFSNLTDHLYYINFENNKLSYLPENLFKNLLNLRYVNFASNSIDTLSLNLFEGLINLEEMNFSWNQLTQLHAKAFAGLPKLKCVDFRCDYTNIDKFSSWNSNSLFNEFFIVEKSNQSGLLIKIDVFNRYLNMYCLSKIFINKNEPGFDLEAYVEANKFSDFTPIDLFLAIDRISNKLLLHLIKYVNYIMQINKIKDCEFKVRNLESIAYLCKRDNEELMLNLRPFFEAKNFSACFEIALEYKNEAMAIALFKVFWDLICKLYELKSNAKEMHDRFLYEIKGEHYGVHKIRPLKIDNFIIEYNFASIDYLSACYELKWWRFFNELLDAFASDDSFKYLFFTVFEHRLYTKSNAGLKKVMSVSSFNENDNLMELKIRNPQQQPTLEGDDEIDKFEVICIPRQQELVKDSTNFEWKLINDASENHLLHFVVSSKQPHLILHPTTTHFLRYKWQKLPRFIYYFSFCMYVLFVVACTMYLEASERTWRLTAWYISLIFAFVFLIKSICKIGILKLKSYFSEIQNLFELINYPIWIFTLLFDTQLKNALKAIAIVLTYAILVLRLEQSRFVGLYVTALKKILLKSIQVLPVMILTSLAFFFALRVSSGEESSSSSTFSYALVQIFAMDLGDFETENIDDSITTTSATTYFIYALYLFVLPFLIANIFLGISVEEMKNLIEDSHCRNVVIRSEYVLKIQDALMNLNEGMNKFCKTKCVGVLIGWLLKGVLATRTSVFEEKEQLSDEIKINTIGEETHTFIKLDEKINRIEDKINDVENHSEVSFIQLRNQLDETSSQIAQIVAYLKMITEKFEKHERI